MGEKQSLKEGGGGGTDEEEEEEVEGEGAVEGRFVDLEVVGLLDDGDGKMKGGWEGWDPVRGRSSKGRKGQDG